MGQNRKNTSYTYIGLNAFDTYQTINFPPNNREINPLIYSWAGKHPNLGEMILFKTVMTTGELYMLNKITNHKMRKGLLIAINLGYIGLISYNEKKTGGILFKKEF